jgi:hypothetical protein
MWIPDPTFLGQERRFLGSRFSTLRLPSPLLGCHAISNPRILMQKLETAFLAQFAALLIAKCDGNTP